MSLSNLGILYYKIGETEKTKELYIEAHEIRKKAYNQNPDKWLEDYVGSLNNLGVLYSKTGEIEKAEKFYIEFFEVIKPAYEQNPDRWLELYIKSLDNLKALYIKTRQAKNLLDIILKIISTLEGKRLTPKLQEIYNSALGILSAFNKD